jgi:hypothetical protein
MNGFWLFRYAIAVLLVAEWLAQQQPRVHGLAYAAPLSPVGPVSDRVTKPVVAPHPAACVYSSTQCGCYSQQGTRLEVPADLCKSIVGGGLFDDGQGGRPADVRDGPDHGDTLVSRPPGIDVDDDSLRFTKARAVASPRAHHQSRGSRMRGPGVGGVLPKVGIPAE